MHAFFATAYQSMSPSDFWIYSSVFVSVMSELSGRQAKNQQKSQIRFTFLSNQSKYKNYAMRILIFHTNQLQSEHFLYPLQCILKCAISISQA
jgi:hypothetical protein